MLRAHRLALDPAPAQARALASHCGAARSAFNQGLAHVKRSLDQREAERSYGVPEDQLTPVPWSLSALRRWWNSSKDELAPWWRENSKEAYSSGLDALARGLAAWSGSRSGKRRGPRAGFPRFKSRRRGRVSCRFTTGAIRVDDPTHVVLPRIGRVKTHEPATVLLAAVRAGTARVLAATVSFDGRRWYCAFTVETGAVPGRPGHVAADRAHPVVGVDLGVRDLLVAAAPRRYPHPGRRPGGRSAAVALVKVRILGGLALAAALAACGSSALYGVPGAERPSSTPTLVPGSRPYDVSGLRDPAGGKFLGVQAPGAPDSLGPVRSFAASAGARPNLIGQYMSWNNPLDTQAVTSAWSYGALYYMVWEPYHTTVAAIADGRSNGYVTRFAQEVRALNLPVAISFGHEFNGFWYPWGTTGTTAAQFVAAWRLIHRLFAAAHATNVIWVWNPNVISAEPRLDLSAYYPGDAYVDWVGVTGYFGAEGPGTFEGVYGPTMQEIRGFTTKPFFIAETSVQTGPDAAAAAQNLVTGVRQRSDVLGFVWFDYDKAGVDWRLESRPPVRAPIAAGLAGLRLVDTKRP